MQHWIGTSGFQYPEWKGTFYPETMPAAKMLPYYAQHFTSTEINYTFRSFPSGKTIGRWIDLTPDAFRFSLKAPQRVTHFARLKDCGETLGAFVRAVEGLGAKLGPVLFQLPANFHKDTPLLADFLAQVPKGLKAAFEFRDPGWFADDVFAALEKGGAALCIAESADLATPAVATAAFGYLRLRREDYTNADVERWAQWLAGQTSRWDDAFTYFKHEERGIGPKLAASMRARLGA